MTGPTAHAALGASSAYRWMACPGSVELTKDIPRKSSAYSLEGTAAHAMGELAIKEGKDPVAYVGEDFDGVIGTLDMANAVKVYVDYVWGLKDAGYQVEIEHRFSLEKLEPPAPMFGTSDCVAYSLAERLLVVADYKHGAGVPVEVEDNPQLKYYALGALLSMNPDAKVQTVRLAIIQPRAQHKDGPVRTFDLPAGELLDFAEDLLAAAHRTTLPDAPLAAGKHCRFCAAQPMCPELHREAQLVATEEFAKPLVDPRLLSPEQLGAILEKADLIEDWLRSIRQHVQTELESGRDVPGWKVVPKRASRVWANEREVLDWAKQQGLQTDELYDQKLKSPAALEKVVGKKNLPEALVAKVSSGYTLAPANDPRPAITNVAADEFSALTGPSV